MAQILGTMLQKRNVGHLINRSLPKRNHQLNIASKAAGLPPKFTSLTSKKFQPYLVSLDINYLNRDFRTKAGVVISVWKNLLAHLYSKRVLFSYFLALLLLLTITSQADYPNWFQTRFKYARIAASYTNRVQMDASIVASSIPTFQWPVAVEYISTFYSYWHPGLDLPDPYGAPVKSSAPGTVVEVDTNWFGYGKSVVINHVDNYASRYAHLSKINVKVGDKVTANTVIGNVGSTGQSTGNHLHFEIYSGGQTLNPINLLPARDLAVNTK